MIRPTPLAGLEHFHDERKSLPDEATQTIDEDAWRAPPAGRVDLQVDVVTRPPFAMGDFDLRSTLCLKML